ncbi:MAG: potassium-transporting ATPase subunit KdpC [Chloroflexaceae bacterium]|nr:potassium-transporting ATPase subunit KdpC [Chloroflexaceae bacterium]
MGMIRQQIRPTLMLVLMMTLITGGIYPLTVTGFAQVLFPYQAGGSLIEHRGQVVGSRLIGQAFRDPGAFWGRLSATAPFPYQAAASSGSNYGPLNPNLLAAARARVEALRGADPTNTAPIPIDLVTASGSGLDPHISPAAAAYQVARVARSRGLDEAVVRQLVATHTQGRGCGLLGEPVVNVLALNIALENLAGEEETSLAP